MKHPHVDEKETLTSLAVVRDLLVRGEGLEQLDLLDLQVDLDLKDLLDLLERRAFLGRKDLSAQLDGMGFRALWDCLVLPDLLGYQERMETRQGIVLKYKPARK
uniref:Uncharacterized protein n=1 Tax=Knipowitschia caucasica TaxID=637954 RepID=A0AAV2K3L1_KNICA